MLLRRVIDHVKAQNWTAVALDFLIVVMGVFIGIQVSNWNNVRAERVEEQKILARLITDFRDIIETGDAYLERRAQQQRLLAEWIDAAENEGPLDLQQYRELVLGFYEKEDPAHARALADASITTLFTDPVSGERQPEISFTFQQIVQSGDLGLIRSEAVRRALTRRDAQRLQALRWIDINWTGSRNPGSAFTQAVFHAGSPDPEYILSESIADPEFAAGLRTFYSLRQFNDRWFRATHEVTKEVLSVLEAETGAS